MNIYLFLFSILGSNILLGMQEDALETFRINAQDSEAKILALPGSFDDNISYEITCELDRHFYTKILDTVQPARKFDRKFSYYGLKVDCLSPEIPIFHATKGRKFRKTGEYLKCPKSEEFQTSSTSFQIFDSRDGFFLIEPQGSRGKKPSKVWISKKYVTDFEKLTGTINNGIARRKIMSKIKIDNAINKRKNIAVTIPISHIFLADQLPYILKFHRASFESTNCGIHCLLAAITLHYPQVLDKLIDNPQEIIAELERESIHENPTRLTDGLKMIGTAGALFLALSAEDASQVLDLGVGLATGLSLMGLGSFLPKLEKSVRKNIGIMPHKLEKLGAHLLRMLELDEKIKFVYTHKDNFAEAYEDWHRLIENGSPVIVLERNNYLSGHFVVLHSLLNNGGGAIWNRGSFNTLGVEHMEGILDCKTNTMMTLTSFLAGIDHHFIYFYFEGIL